MQTDLFMCKPIKIVSAIGFFILISFLMSCNGETICPSYPAKYSYTFSENDFKPFALYDYDESLITASDDDLIQVLQAGGLYEGSGVDELLDAQSLVLSFTITSPDMIDATVQLGDRDTTFTLAYSLIEQPNFYRIISESELIYDGVEIYEDCSAVEICNWFLISIIDGKLQNSNVIQGCHLLSEDNLEQELLRYTTRLRPGVNQLALIRFNLLYELQE